MEATLSPFELQYCKWNVQIHHHWNQIFLICQGNNVIMIQLLRYLLRYYIITLLRVIKLLPNLGALRIRMQVFQA